MTQESYKHPIAPPPELVQQLVDDHFGAYVAVNGFHKDLATRAAQWGADQELEACCKWLEWNHSDLLSRELRAARRPEPKQPSAVAQAEALIERYEDGWCPSPAQWHVIREGLAEGRRALEQLDD